MKTKKNILTNKKNTNFLYSIFSDEEEFVADQGRGQELGEVFSPKELVDLMLDTSGISNSPSDATIFEPGSGSGNFVCEILHQKLKKVFDEIYKDKITKPKELRREYEVRSLLALGSITFNDIDISNIERIKHRLSSIMLSEYIKYFKNAKIGNYYYKAVSDIVSSNAILGDFISKNYENFLFVRYYRASKTKISRYVFKLNQIFNYTLFTNDDPIYNDEIEYNNWILEICGHDISKEQPSLSCKRNKQIFDQTEESIYKKTKSDI